MLSDEVAEMFSWATSISCFFGGLLCGYIMQVILRERAPLIQWQRAGLVGLGIALMANSVIDYPNWALIMGHRPTGMLVDVALFINLLIMAIRGHIIWQTPHKTNS